MSREPRGRRRSSQSFAAAGLRGLLVLLCPGLDAWAQSAAIVAAPGASASAPAAAAGAVAAAPSAGSVAPALVAPLSLAAAPLSAPAPVLPAAPSAAAPAPAFSVSAAPLFAPAAPSAAASALPAAAPALAAARAASTPDAASARGTLDAGTRGLAAAPAGRGAALDALYEGSRRAGSPLDDVRVFIGRPDRAAGESAASVPLSGLAAAIAADPALKATLARAGRVRLVLAKSGGGLTRADAAAVRESLRAAGVDAKLEIENIALGAKAEAPAAPAAGESAPQTPAPARGPVARALSWAAAPFREAAYLARTLGAAMTKPTLGAVAAGVVMKFVIPMVVLRQAGWIASYAGHPVAMGLALGFTVAINLFHGVWVGTWANFQNNLAKQRGLNYQAVFNFVYGQMLGVVSRVIAWTTIPDTVPPWSPRYWKDVGIMAVVGTFFGTLGYQGINALYNNGRLSQRARDGIFLARDLVMNLAGFFFGSGSMAVFWTVFLVQQATDLAIYALSRRLKARAILYVADGGVAAAPEFAVMYPVGPKPAAEESPLKQAWSNLLQSPFVKPFAWAARKVRGVFRKS